MINFLKKSFFRYFQPCALHSRIFVEVSSSCFRCSVFTSQSLVPTLNFEFHYKKFLKILKHASMQLITRFIFSMTQWLRQTLASFWVFSNVEKHSSVDQKKFVTVWSIYLGFFAHLQENFFPYSIRQSFSCSRLFPGQYHFVRHQNLSIRAVLMKISICMSSICIILAWINIVFSLSQANNIEENINQKDFSTKKRLLLCVKEKSFLC